MRKRLALTLIAGGLSLSACAAGEGLGAAGPAYADNYSAAPPYFDQTACWTYGWSGNIDYPYCGWYNGFFYPGSGVYVYDRDHHRRVWSSDQQGHWAARNPVLSSGMHSPGPVRIPGAFGGHGFGHGAGGGFGGTRGGGNGFGGGVHVSGSGHGGGHSGR
jgi:hypothetical protein